MRVNPSQEFVIGGYTLGGRHFDALIFGYWEGHRLMYAARTRSGSLRPYASSWRSGSGGWRRWSVRLRILPEARVGRWGEGLTAAKMKDSRWLLCRMRHSSHNVECRTMPYAFGGLDSGSVWARFREYGPDPHTA
jgi:hypothetical protein